MCVCVNGCIHHGSISHLRALVQMRTKENKGQKKKNLKELDWFSFLLQIYFQPFLYYFHYDNEYRHVSYFDRSTRLS